MTRMDHSSTRAAKAYLHAPEERDRQPVDVLDRMALRELKPSGTAWNVPIGHAGVQRPGCEVWAIMVNKPAELAIRHMERVTGIEPALSAWEADVLPLNYTRDAPSRSDAPARHAPTSYRKSGRGTDQARQTALRPPQQDR